MCPWELFEDGLDSQQAAAEGPALDTVLLYRLLQAVHNLAASHHFAAFHDLLLPDQAYPASDTGECSYRHYPTLPYLPYPTPPCPTLSCSILACPALPTPCSFALTVPSSAPPCPSPSCPALPSMLPSKAVGLSAISACNLRLSQCCITALWLTLSCQALLCK